MDVFINMGQILWFSYLICDEKKSPFHFKNPPYFSNGGGIFPLQTQILD